MPAIAAAAAATASSVIAAGGVASTTFSLFGLSLSGFGAVAAQFAVRAALGYAMNALSDTHTRGAPLSRGYQTVNRIGPALPRQIIYGETRIGGVVFYQTLTTGTSTDDRLHRCIAFAGHEIESYEAIYLNDEEVTLDGSGNVTAPSQYVGKVRIKQYLGTSTQAADSDLVSEVSEWTSSHRARGVAYLYVRFEDAAAFPGGTPTVTAKIRGRKVYDMRTDTTVWSDNPALCIRDYLLASYGLRETSSGIDDTLFEAAADACDATVAGGGKLYTLNGAFLLDAIPEEIIRNLLSAMGGTFWNYAGLWAVLPAEYREPTLTLTEDDLRGPVSVATRHSRRNNFNIVRGQYKGAATNYQPDDYTEVTSAAWVEEDNGIEATTELNLLFSDTESMARRIAQTFLRRNRQQETVSASFGLRALDLKVGDTVQLTVSHLGYVAKTFEVVDWRFGMKEQDINVNMILREITAEVFEGVTAALLDQSGNNLLDQSDNNLEGIVG